MSRIKNVNTNTNINRININVPRQYRPRQKKKTVAQAENDLSRDEFQDRQVTYQPQGISINPNVYGFNTSPINREVGIPETTTERPDMRTGTTQTETERVPKARPGRSMATQTRNIREQTARREAKLRGETETFEMGTNPMLFDEFARPPIAVAEPYKSPSAFRSSSTPEDRGEALTVAYTRPEYKLNIPSDFPSRLSQQEGFQPSSYTSGFNPTLSGSYRMIDKQARPDISFGRRDLNEMARELIAKRQPQKQPLLLTSEEIGTGERPISVSERVKSISQKASPVFPKARPKPEFTYEATYPGEKVQQDVIPLQTAPAEPTTPGEEQKKRRGRQPGQKFEGGYKTKPKPQKAEMITQTGESLKANVESPLQMEIKKVKAPITGTLYNSAGGRGYLRRDPISTVVQL